MGPDLVGARPGFVYTGTAIPSRTMSEPIVAQVFAMPELSLALTVISWIPSHPPPSHQRPAGRPPGSVGSSMVTADEVV